MVYMKECTICGKEFEFRRQTDKTCSLDCQIEYRRKINREKARRHYKPKPPRPDVDCGSCGAKVKVSQMGPTPKWCTECRAKHEDRRARKRQVGSRRKCHTCGTPTPEAEGKPGPAVCNDCRVDPRANSYEKERRRTLRKYGITQDDYDRMLHDQGNKCPICKTADPGTKGWCIDHCHDTGNVRSLLCNPCNMAIGQANENPDVLRAMADYVEAWEKVKI